MIVESFKQSVERTKRLLKEHFLFDDIQIVFKDQFQEQINIQNVLKRIEATVPRMFFKDLDIIYVGLFPHLQARNVESAFMNGAIFLSSQIVDDETLLKSIIHEVAHSVESVYSLEVYGDRELADEFLTKREKLKAIMNKQKLFCEPRYYSQMEFTTTFDDFLYKTVGYDRMATLTNKLFISPYAATSLKEYFANGFEHYFVDENPKYFKQISPKLFNKITALTKIED